MRTFTASVRRTTALAAVLAAGLVTPAPAETIAPPGNSGVDQYLEVVPSAKGNSKPNGNRKALSPKARRELANQGETGRQLQRVVESTAPSPARSRPKHDPKPAASAPAARGDSPLSSVGKALTDGSGGGGMGAALPVLLIVSTAALAAVALRRRSA